MAKGSLGTAIQRLRLLVAASDARGLSDRELLERFAERQDEAAFAALVQRHGPLVLGVCRRVLGNEHDADDAFQATFLVLARKAATVRWQDSVRSWLYEVAYRTAREARSRILRRRSREKQLDDTVQPPSPAAVSWHELHSVLDEEIQRLPEQYRAPLVLCCLEGKTRDEAAERLGWTVGAVKGRLERGRDLLRRRLTRRGLTLSAALLATVLTESGAAASVPPLLLVSTLKAGMQFASCHAAAELVPTSVLTLANGVLQAMFVTKLKAAAALVFAVGLIASGAGLVGHHALAARPADQPSFAAEPQDRGRRDTPELRGILKSVDAKVGTIAIRGTGEANPGDQNFNLVKEVKVVIDGKDAKLTDLAEGMLVFLKVSEASGDVVGIRTEGTTQGGVVRSVDPAGSRITLAGADGPSFAVAPDAKIVLDGNAAKLGDIKAGTRVTLRLSADRKTVLGLTAGGGREDGGDRRDRPEILGIVAALDPAKRTLTLTIRADAGAFDRTFTLDKEVKVLSGERAVDLADVEVGTPISVKLIENQNTVALIRLNVDRRAEAPGGRAVTVQGVFKEADATRSTIVVTVKGDGGVDRERRYELSKEVKVWVASKEDAKLADLKAGMRVALVLGPDRRTVIQVKEVRGEDAGAIRGKDAPTVVVKAVDAAKGTITLGGDRESRTLEVAKDAKVILDGKPATLADVKPGTRVSLQLAEDRKTVIGIFAGRDRDREEKEEEG